MWSFRFYESVMLGCIPVIIADHIEMPFEDMIDYRSFSVKILESQVVNLKVRSTLSHATSSEYTGGHHTSVLLLIMYVMSLRCRIFCLAFRFQKSGESRRCSGKSGVSLPTTISPNRVTRLTH